MFRRNLPAWERLVRAALAIGLLVVAFVVPMPTWAFWIAIAAGAGMLGTSAASYCPACAVAGRKPVADR